MTLAGCATTGAETAANSREMKLVFDFTDANPVVLLNRQTNVDTTRKQLLESGITPKILMIFRGNASYFTQTGLTAVKEGDRVEPEEVMEQPVPAYSLTGLRAGA